MKPKVVAEHYIKSNVDQIGFKKKFINTEIGMLIVLTLSSIDLQH